jgi:hypothetical protein
MLRSMLAPVRQAGAIAAAMKAVIAQVGPGRNQPPG